CPVPCVRFVRTRRADRTCELATLDAFGPPRRWAASEPGRFVTGVRCRLSLVVHDDRPGPWNGRREGPASSISVWLLSRSGSSRRRLDDLRAARAPPVGAALDAVQTPGARPGS